MGNWRWDGLDKSGKRTLGVIEASNQREARRLLRAKGIRTKSLKPPSILEFDINEWLIDKGIAKAFGTKELTNFTKQMAIMVNAGVPIIMALEIIYKSEKNISLKKAVKNIAREVSEGKTMAESMMNQKGFDKLYCNLVKAGEIGGILDTILSKLAEHLDKAEKTKQQIKSAMTYPAMVTGIGAGVVWALITFVVPQFVGMLTDTGQEIPGITKFVIGASVFFENYSLYLIPGLILFTILFMSWKNTPSGKGIFDKIILHVPGIGQVIIKGNLSHFARTLATLLSAGVSLVDSLEICVEIIDNDVMSKDIAEVKKKVVEGKTLTEPLMKIDYFPEMVSQMIKVGEQTGSIDIMLEKISIVFEDEVNQAVENATKMIEPLVLVVLGGIIAVVLIAIYLPMFMAGGGAD